MRLRFCPPWIVAGPALLLLTTPPSAFGQTDGTGVACIPVSEAGRARVRVFHPRNAGNRRTRFRACLLAPSYFRDPFRGRGCRGSARQGR